MTWHQGPASRQRATRRRRSRQPAEFFDDAGGDDAERPTAAAARTRASPIGADRVRDVGELACAGDRREMVLYVGELGRAGDRAQGPRARARLGVPENPRDAHQRFRVLIGPREIVAVGVVPGLQLLNHITKSWPRFLTNPVDAACVIVGTPIASVDVMPVGMSCPTVAVVVSEDRTPPSNAGMVRVDVCLHDDVVITVEHIQRRGVRRQHPQILLDRQRDVAEATDVADHDKLLRPRNDFQRIRTHETRRPSLTEVPGVRADVAAKPSG